MSQKPCIFSILKQTCKRFCIPLFCSKEDCKFYDQMEKIILKGQTADEQTISELDSLTDSDSGIYLHVI